MQYGQQIGVPKLACHDLRRTFAQLAEVGHERIQESVKSFRISSGYGRVCTTFLVGSEVFGNRDAEQVE
jgi:hypothetical protein